jgi:hypothetical protein
VEASIGDQRFGGIEDLPPGFFAPIRVASSHASILENSGSAADREPWDPKFHRYYCLVNQPIISSDWIIALRST